MRLNLEALPGEVEGKSVELVKALHDILEPLAPDAAHLLEKAIPAEDVRLRHPVLRQISSRMQRAYDKRLKLMIADVMKVLEPTSKSN